MKNLWIALIVVAVVIVGYFVLGQKPKEVTGEPIKIGVAIPLTGIAAIAGENEKSGIELAAGEINKSGGIAGRPLALIIEDDHTDATQSVSAVEKLISVDKATALIGGTWDFLANAVEPVVDKDGVVLVTPSTLPDTLEKTSPYLFVTHSPVAINERAITAFLKKTPGSKVAIMSVNNLWGQAHLNTFKKSIAASGKTLVKEVIVPQFDNNDLQTDLATIKAAKADSIITALNFGDSVAFLKKKAALGIDAKVLGDYHYIDGYQQGNIPKELLTGVTVFVFSDPTQAFIDTYVGTYRRQPGTYADTAYDAVYVLKQAIENSGGKTDSASIVAGLHKINDYNGASGHIDFSQNNYPANKQPLLKIFGGSGFVPVNL
ncbi:ABC transporter substrate-binding protein [Candidatus Kaiserbacteria bacterium]|nr:ABC transporter substrate-binding protein [Candidatus Kaiserbacteria bacterium]